MTGTLAGGAAETAPGSDGELGDADHPHGRQAARARTPRTVLTLGEATAAVAAVAVAAVGVASLALAQLGHHDGLAALALGLVVTAAIVAGMVALGGLPAIAIDPIEIGLVAAVAVAAVFFFAPGSPYAYGDKDPGVYVAHAFAIARDGDVTIPDEVQERGLDPVWATERGRFPGLWIDDHDDNAITPQFFHLYPALLATVDDLAGGRALFNATPALAVLSVVFLVLAVRRAAGTVVAAVAGALMVTSMIQVWQARYPSTEILAQMLLCGALLATVLALERRWAPGAFVAGLLLGVGFLTRPDGFVYLILAAGVVGVAVAARRVDHRLTALAAGIGLTMPYAMWYAYVSRSRYAHSNDLPRPLTLLAMALVPIAAGLGVRVVLTGVARRRGDPAATGPGLFELLRRWQRPLGILGAVSFGLVLVVLWFREDLFGPQYTYSHFVEATVRSWDERNIIWLSWFVTVPGLVLLAAGVAVLVLQRATPAMFALMAPATVLLPLYLWDARISMRLMWWVRRFVPAALPGLLLAIALALAWALLNRRWSLRIAGAAATVVLVAVFAGQSLPLRDHREMRGSLEMATDISGLAGDQQGVFLYTESNGVLDPMRNTPTPVWFIFDELVGQLHPDYDIDEIEAYREAFPGQPVFLITHERQLPAHLPPDRFEAAWFMHRDLTYWEETSWEGDVHRRPDRSVTTSWELTFWRLTG